MRYIFVKQIEGMKKKSRLITHNRNRSEPKKIVRLYSHLLRIKMGKKNNRYWYIYSIYLIYLPSSIILTQKDIERAFRFPWFGNYQYRSPSIYIFRVDQDLTPEIDVLIEAEIRNYRDWFYQTKKCSWTWLSYPWSLYYAYPNHIRISDKFRSHQNRARSTTRSLGRIHRSVGVSLAWTDHRIDIRSVEPRGIPARVRYEFIQIDRLLWWHQDRSGYPRWYGKC